MPEEVVTETPPADAPAEADAPAQAETSFETVEAAVAELAKVRQEAASRRVSLKQYEPFEKYNEDDRAVWTQLASLMFDDPEAGAKALIEVGQALIGTPQEETPVPETETADDAPDLSPAGIQKMIADALAAERTSQAEEHKKGEVARNFEAQAEKLGYTKGTPQYTTLLHFAANDPSPDGDPVAGAHEKVQAFLQEQVDTFVKARKADADGSATPPSGAGAGLPAAEKPKTLEEASAAFAKMLQDQRQDV